MGKTTSGTFPVSELRKATSRSTSSAFNSSPEPGGADNGHGLFQIPNLARMKVRRGECYVAQRRRAENIGIVSCIGDRKAALVLFRQDLALGFSTRPNW